MSTITNAIFAFKDVKREVARYLDKMPKNFPNRKLKTDTIRMNFFPLGRPRDSTR